MSLYLPVMRGVEPDKDSVMLCSTRDKSYLIVVFRSLVFSSGVLIHLWVLGKPTPTLVLHDVMSVQNR